MWRVVGNDFIEDGPVSRWCEVTIDRRSPGTPTVSSADGLYPECEFPDDATEDVCSHTGRAGTAGAFRLLGDSDVVRFQYSIEGGGLIERGTVPAVGGVATRAPTRAATVMAMPPAGAARADRRKGISGEWRTDARAGHGLRSLRLPRSE